MAGTAKKLPFKPTALRKAGKAGKAAATPSATPESDSKKDQGGDDEADPTGLELFNRRKEMERILAADLERRAAKSRKQKEAERQRRRSSAKRRSRSVEEEGPSDGPGEGDGIDRSPISAGPTAAATGDTPSELVTPPPSKRARTSSASARRPKTPSSQAIDSPSAGRSRTRLSAARERRERPPPSPSRAPIVALDSESDGGGAVDDDAELVEELPPDPPGQTRGQEEEEDEFAEYIRKAEEDRKRNQQSRGSGAGDGAPSEPAKVELLLQSSIEGSRDCFIKVFLDSPLIHVRSAWAMAQERHGIELAVPPNDLILTWRRTKVYPYSTLHSLGIRPYGDGMVTDIHGTRGLGRGRSQVHMEVWTPEMFQRWEDEDEQRRRRAQEGELSDDDEDGGAGGGGAAAGDEPEQPERKIKVVLKARDLGDVGLTVRPETTAETLMTGFRATKGLGPDTAITLMFDGERLEEHVTMEEADIDDMDAIEVHIK